MSTLVQGGSQQQVPGPAEPIQSSRSLRATHNRLATGWLVLVMALLAMTTARAQTNPCTNPSLPTISATRTAICAGSSTILSVQSGSLNDATNWHWYSGSCGGTPAGTGPAIQVSPSSTTTYYVRGEGGCVTPGSCASQQITVNAPFFVNLTNNGPLTCVKKSVTLTTTGAPSGANYTYSAGAQASSASSATVTTSGGYSVTATVLGGCSATANTIVSSNTTAPSVSINPASQTVCQGQSANFTAQGADAFQWSTNATSAMISVSVAGPYSVTATATSNGCSATATASLSVNPLPTSFSLTGGGAYCIGGAGVPVGLSGSQTGVNYQLRRDGNAVGSPVAGTGSALSLGNQTTAGTYTVLATNATTFCQQTMSGSASVSVNTPPSVSLVNNGPLTCAQTSVTLTASGGTSYTFATGSGILGTPGATNALVVSSAGMYSVRVANASGCVSTTTITISSDASTPIPTLSASPSTTLTCAQTSLTLTAGGGSSYSFSPNALSQSGNTAVVNAPGLYSVTVTSGTSGCFSTTALIISQDNSLPVLSISPSSATLTCASPSVNLTAVGTGTLVWDNNSTNAIRSVSTAGTYSVTLTSINGCTAFTSVSVSADQSAPSVSISPSSATLTCANPLVTLTTLGTGSVRWSTGATSSTIAVSSANIYSVTLTSPAGCMATARVMISQDQATPTVNVTPSSTTLTCASPSVRLTTVGAGTVLWNTGSTASAITATTSGTYSVTLTNANGCMATASAVVVQDQTAPSVNISPSSATLTCASPSVSLTAVGTGSVLWSTAETTPTITVYAANIYSVTLTSANGCTATAQTTVFSSTSLVAPSLTASALATSNQPISVTATGCTGGTINWTLLGGSGSADGPIYTLSQPGSYTLSATCSIGQCSSSPSQALSLQIQPGGPFRLVAPTYDCATGAITFNTLGGDGTLIQYFAIGITPWTTQANQTIEAGLRGDPKVILLQAQQSGVMVSYSFDLPAFCSGLQPPPPPIPNQPPVVNTTIATQTATLGSAYTFSLPAGTFTDPESQTLAYSALGLPAGLTLVGTTLSGTPTAEGFTTVTIIAQDPGGLTANTSFGLSVLPLNPQPPTGGGLTLLTPLYNCESGAITFRTSGGDGSPVEYFAIGITGWTTQANQTVEAGLRADPKVLTLHARQNGVEAATLDFDMKAYCSGPPVNQPPVVNAPIANQQVVVNSSYSFTIPGGTFTDPEGGPLTYSISGLPASLSATGSTISGVPSQTGVSTVTVTVIDNGGLTASTSFQLRVTPINVPPPVSTTLVLVAPTYNCASGAITFTTQGGDGSLIEYMAIGVTGWTSNPNQYVDQGLRTATDAGPLSLLARQSGVVVSYSFNLVAYCRGGARQASLEELPLRVVVLGNPVVTDRVRFEVRGAEGQPLRVSLISGSGKLVSEQGIERAGAIEIQTLEVGPQWAGVLLLRVSSPTQSQVVKVLKGE